MDYEKDDKFIDNAVTMLTSTLEKELIKLLKVYEKPGRRMLILMRIMSKFCVNICNNISYHIPNMNEILEKEISTDKAFHIILCTIMERCTTGAVIYE